MDQIKGGKLMTQISMDEKFKRSAEVICKQGMVQFPLSDTAIAIVVAVVGENQEELDLIYAFRDKPSQTADQLVESSGFAADKVERLATSLAKKGLVFNQPSSAGVMIYRLLPLMLVGVMEYKFMVPLTGSEEEKELARLFEQLLAELRDQIQENYDALSPLFNTAPAVDRTVPTRTQKTAIRLRSFRLTGALKFLKNSFCPARPWKTLSTSLMILQSATASAANGAACWATPATPQRRP
jgi:hypothetical protein